MNRYRSFVVLIALLGLATEAAAERRSLTMAKQLARQARSLADGQMLVLDARGGLDLQAMASSAAPVSTVDLRALSRLQQATARFGDTVRRFNDGRAAAMKPGETLTITRTGNSVTIVTNRVTGRSTRRSFLLEPEAATHVASGVHYRGGRERLFKLDAAALGRAMSSGPPSAPITLNGRPLSELPIVGVGQLPIRLGRTASLR